MRTPNVRHQPHGQRSFTTTSLIITCKVFLPRDAIYNIMAFLPRSLQFTLTKWVDYSQAPFVPHKLVGKLFYEPHPFATRTYHDSDSRFYKHLLWHLSPSKAKLTQMPQGTFREFIHSEGPQSFPPIHGGYPDVLWELLHEPSHLRFFQFWALTELRK